MDKALEILNKSELHKIPNEISITDETNGTLSYIISVGFMVAVAYLLIKTISDANEKRLSKTSDRGVIQ